MIYKFKLAYGGRTNGMMFAGLAALAATQSIGMTIPRRYGKIEAMRQAGLVKEAARALKVSRRENKQHKLKGLRP